MSDHSDDMEMYSGFVEDDDYEECDCEKLRAENERLKAEAEKCSKKYLHEQLQASDAARMAMRSALERSVSAYRNANVVPDALELAEKALSLDSSTPNALRDVLGEVEKALDELSTGKWASSGNVLDNKDVRFIATQALSKLRGLL